MTKIILWDEDLRTGMIESLHMKHYVSNESIQYTRQMKRLSSNPSEIITWFTLLAVIQLSYNKIMDKVNVEVQQGCQC